MKESDLFIYLFFLYLYYSTKINFCQNHFVYTNNDRKEKKQFLLIFLQEIKNFKINN